MVIRNSTLRSLKLVKDEDTAYDEVIRDINGLSHFMLSAGEDLRFEAHSLITKKCKQLMRLLNDDDSELE